jgi:hypothetical protein
MLNLKNKFLAVFAIAVSCTGMSSAATLIRFDRPNLVVVFDKKNTYGYYAGYRMKKSAFADTPVSHECKFMFMRVKGLHDVSVRSLEHPIKDWDSAPYAEGLIRVDGPVWQIQFSDPQRGCESGADQDDIVVPPAFPETNLTEYATRGARFTVVKKTKVVGIRWIGSKTVLQRRAKGKFVSTDVNLGAGTLVVELQKSGACSEVEYFDAQSGKQVKGWVQSAKLGNPYPKR